MTFKQARSENKLQVPVTSNGHDWSGVWETNVRTCTSENLHGTIYIDYSSYSDSNNVWYNQYKKLLAKSSMCKQSKNWMGLLTEVKDWIKWSRAKNYSILEPPDIFRWLIVEGMSFRGGIFVFFPHFDGLVSFTCNKPRTSYVESSGVYSSFTVQWTWGHTNVYITR